MTIVGDALKQVFMPKHEYESLRDEHKVWFKLQRPIVISVFAFVMLLILISVAISLKMVFPGDLGRRPFCRDLRIEKAPENSSSVNEDRADGALYLKDQEIVDYFWMVVFVPSAIVFLLSAVYLVAGIAVAYTAPTRNGCLRVVENKYCASKRGGVRCLFILNFMFSIIFGLLAIFLGSTLLRLGNSCSVALFWCYETASWGLVTLYAGTASLLKRTAVDDSQQQFIGVEMLEMNPVEFTPDVERRVNEGFRSWMGSSYMSSDDEDDLDGYREFPHFSRSNSYRQRV